MSVYASVTPTQYSEAVFRDRLDKLGITPSNKDPLHCTLMYSEVSPNRVVPIRFKQYRSRVTKLMEWAGHDGDGYLVAYLDSPELQARNKVYLDAGCVSSFPDYIPHVTLITPFELGSLDLSLINSILAKSPSELFLDSEKAEPLRK